MRLIGFWASGYWDTTQGKWIPDKNSPYPMPIPKETLNNKSTFVKRLSMIEDELIESGSYYNTTFFDKCRLCGETVGTVIYKWNNYHWPNSLSHYILKHNVQPPNDFVQDIVLNTSI